MSVAYFVSGLRTPFGRYGGDLAAVRPDDLAAGVVRALIASQPSVGWGLLDDVIIGCANQAGEDCRNVARMTVLLSGLPVEIPGMTVNRLCASSLDAINLAARSIKAGDADLVIAGGVESMTRAPFVTPKSATAWGRTAELFDTTIGARFVNPAIESQFGTHSMPQTAQIVADEFSVSREDQDAFALRSQQRAAASIARGRLAREISPVEVPVRKGPPTIVDTDQHPRAITAEKLAALKPLFPGGSVTAGNASGVNDGAVAVLVASERAVRTYGLTPLARITSGVATGVPPRTMGMGPESATKYLLERNKLTIGDIDVIELNEAFASQCLAVLRGLGLPDDAEHVNPTGGAIALGHPLGASGARLALTAVTEMSDRGARRAVATMCVGVGQGVAILFEAP
ncbi:MAG: acetyl-CoA C-acyltransferase [Solirubrobacteraceae bacterium]|nr:acetyl-CoA C-acyltransferase [Solirubrobacteraceae bacterium]MDZ4248872.1 acetyl-CoA C-acyltransferase [Candidatus Nanopelagicales bacterium]